MNTDRPCPRIDLQVHTTLSDGARSVDEVIAAAARAGVAHLGVTDHLLTAKLAPEHVVLPGQVSDYAACVRAAAAAAPSGLRVWVGMEVDFSKRTKLKTLAGDVPWDVLDFVLLEYVEDRLYRGKSLADLVKLRADIPCRVGLAHNDISRNFADVPPAELVASLDQARIFVELCCGARNAKVIATKPGVDVARALEKIEALTRRRLRLADAQPYRLAAIDAELAGWRARVRAVPAFLDGSAYLDEFFAELAGSKVRLSMGTDSHEEDDVIGAVDEAMSFVEAHGLVEHLVSRQGGDWP